MSETMEAPTAPRPPALHGLAGDPGAAPDHPPRAHLPFTPGRSRVDEGGPSPSSRKQPEAEDHLLKWKVEALCGLRSDLRSFITEEVAARVQEQMSRSTREPSEFQSFTPVSSSSQLMTEACGAPHPLLLSLAGDTWPRDLDEARAALDLHLKEYGDALHRSLEESAAALRLQIRREQYATATSTADMSADLKEEVRDLAAGLSSLKAEVAGIPRGEAGRAKQSLKTASNTRALDAASAEEFDLTHTKAELEEIAKKVCGEEIRKRINHGHEESADAPVFASKVSPESALMLEDLRVEIAKVRVDVAKLEETVRHIAKDVLRMRGVALDSDEDSVDLKGQMWVTECPSDAVKTDAAKARSTLADKMVCAEGEDMKSELAQVRQKMEELRKLIVPTAAKSVRRSRLAEDKEPPKQELKVGMRVVVTQPMRTDSDDAVDLVPGQGGFINAIDSDGDALVFMDGLERVQWIFKANLGKLCAYGEEPANVPRPRRLSSFGPIDRMSYSDLKDLIWGAGLSTMDCFSRTTLLQRAVDAKAHLERMQLSERTKPLPTGLRIQYNSPSQKRWVDCRVIACNEEGAVRIDIKPGHWFPLSEQALKFRPRPFAVGQMVHYRPHGAADDEPWVETMIAAVREDAAVCVKCDPECWIVQLEQFESFSQMDTLPVLHPGDNVVVVRNFDTDSDEPVRLVTGERGVVNELDEDGDALIDFEAHDVAQWVIGSNFEKLCVVGASGGDAGSPGGFTSPGGTTTIDEGQDVEPVVSRRGSRERSTRPAAGGGDKASKVLPPKRRGSVVVQEKNATSESAEPIPLKTQTSGIVSVDEKCDVPDTQGVTQPSQDESKVIAEEFAKSDHVVVTEEFLSDSLDATLLRKGSVGCVEELDLDGDILVDFGDGNKHWVCRDNLDKMTLLKGKQPTSAGLIAESEEKKEEERLEPYGTSCMNMSKKGSLRLVKGCSVVAKDDFMSDNWEPNLIKALSQGCVMEIDGEGDALIEFGDKGGSQWVNKANQEKLIILKNIKPDQADAGSNKSAATADSMRSGQKVVVRATFQSDSTDRVELQAGLKGRIRRIDIEGDALIQFERIRRRQWVFASNFVNLLVVHELESTDTESEEMLLTPGAEVLYNSTSNGRWISCVVAKRRQDGAIQIDAKPGVWISKKTQERRVRRQGEALYRIDQALYYHSPTFKKWVDVEVTKVRKRDGAIQVDAKEGCWFSIEEQMTKLKPRVKADGLIVEVIREITTDSENSQVLKVGRKGVVQEIDPEGDALIQFTGCTGFDWVCKAKLDHLSVVSTTDEVPDFTASQESQAEGDSVDKDHSAEAIRPGATITVLKDFLSDSEVQVALKFGQRGVVIDVDPDGDMLIEFDGQKEQQWVFTHNTKKLGIIQNAALVCTLKQLLEQ